MCTSTKPKNFRTFALPFIFNEAFGERVHRQLLETFRVGRVRDYNIISSRFCILGNKKQINKQTNTKEKNLKYVLLGVFFFFFLHFLKRYGPDRQHETRIEATSCVIAKKMVYDEKSLCK